MTESRGPAFVGRWECAQRAGSSGLGPGWDGLPQAKLPQRHPLHVSPPCGHLPTLQLRCAAVNQERIWAAGSLPDAGAQTGAGPGTVWLTESSHMFTWWAHHPSFMRSRSGTERSSHPLTCTRLMRPNPGHLWGRRHHMLPLGAASRRSPQTNVSYELKRQQNHREPWVSRRKAGFEPHLGPQLAVILHLSLPGNPATSPALHGCREGSGSCPRKCCAHREVPHKSGGGIICTNFTR